MLTMNRDLIIQARESLKNRWGLAVGGNVIYLILVVLVQCVPKVGWIAHLIIGGPLLIGWSVFFLSLSRRQDALISQLFDGFNRFVNGLVAYLLMSLFILLWSLLLIIPGIIACLSYSQTFFILAENPQMEGLEALRKSKILMKGNRWKLFFLFWRFFGWFLLGILSLGIGFLWIMPYLATTLAGFYDDLKIGAGPVSMEGPIVQPNHP
ncbi:MAG: hypothetical protein C0407_11320 [Desulfobacca sp.]|nr:hypothetical protein [Desulfobacca sp.]